MWAILVLCLFLPYSTTDFIRFDWEHVDQSVLDAEPDLKAFLHCTQKCKYSDTCSGIIWDEHKPTAEKCSFKYDEQEEITISKNGVCPSTPTATLDQSPVTPDPIQQATFTILPDDETKPVETTEPPTPTTDLVRGTTSEDDVGTQPSEVGTTESTSIAQESDIPFTTVPSLSSTVESETTSSEFDQETMKSTTTVQPSSSSIEVEVSQTSTDLPNNAIENEATTQTTNGSISSSESTASPTEEGTTASSSPHNDLDEYTKDTATLGAISTSIKEETTTNESGSPLSTVTSTSAPLITTTAVSTEDPIKKTTNTSESESSSSFSPSAHLNTATTTETDSTEGVNTSTVISDSTSSKIPSTTTTRKPTTTVYDPWNALFRMKTGAFKCDISARSCDCPPNTNNADLRITLKDGTYYTAQKIQFVNNQWIIMGINSGSATPLPASVLFERVECKYFGRGFKSVGNQIYTFVIKNGYFSGMKVACPNGFSSSDARGLSSSTFRSLKAITWPYNAWVSTGRGPYSIGIINCN